MYFPIEFQLFVQPVLDFGTKLVVERVEFGVKGTQSTVHGTPVFFVIVVNVVSLVEPGCLFDEVDDFLTVFAVDEPDRGEIRVAWG